MNFSLNLVAWYLAPAAIVLAIEAKSIWARDVFFLGDLLRAALKICTPVFNLANIMMLVIEWVAEYKGPVIRRRKQLKD